MTKPDGSRASLQATLHLSNDRTAGQKHFKNDACKELGIAKAIFVVGPSMFWFF